MISEKIEKIKSEYTDKYVVVQSEKPELARFKEYVGQVKTVNMNGRALVEFGDFNQNIGWYDIELDFLKVVDRPLKKEPQAKDRGKAPPAAKGAKKQPAAAGKKSATSGEKKLSPLELARQQGAAKSSGVASASESAGSTKSTGEAVEKKSVNKPPAGKLSTADILAAARGGSAKKPAESKPAGSKSTGAESSPPDPTKSAGPSSVPAGKLSTAEILAAARGGSVKSPAQEKSSETGAKSEPDVVAEAASESAASAGPMDKSNMTPDDICSWCREHDAG